ncbi:MAG TPA: UvrD-helicase domain-containing protein, partial [Acidimicrobiia bacterium]
MSHPLLADLDASQRAAVTHEAPTLAILAPAGSGKTRVLTRRVAWLVDQRRASAGHVLAVTFTRKAAGELSQRLGRLGVRQVTAGTFHSLA